LVVALQTAAGRSAQAFQVLSVPLALRATQATSVFLAIPAIPVDQVKLAAV
jgi:hypothetical protein